MNRSHRLTTRLTTAGLLMASALALSACGEDEPKPRVKNQPSEVETTVAAEKPETAEEFIRRWFKASEDMQNTGDTDEYLAMAKGCAYCKETAELIEGYYAAGGSVTYEGDRIKSVTPYGKAETRFLVKTQVLPTAYTTASGAPVQHFEGGNDKYVVTLERAGSSWQVLDMTFLVD